MNPTAAIAWDGGPATSVSALISRTTLFSSGRHIANFVKEFLFFSDAFQFIDGSNRHA
jgi:hypothetical protein